MDIFELERLEMALVIREARAMTGNRRLFPNELIRQIVNDFRAQVAPRNLMDEYRSPDQIPTPRRLAGGDTTLTPRRTIVT